MSRVLGWVWLQFGKSNAGPRVEDLAEGARKQRNERTLKPILLFAVIQRARHSATARASRGAGPECWTHPALELDDSAGLAAGNRHADDERNEK